MSVIGTNSTVNIAGNTFHYLERLQSLWSGYGEIARYRADDGATVIVKQIAAPVVSQHPRGWNTANSHQRKLQSYQIEARFYQYYAGRCGQHCRVPTLLQEKNSDSHRLVLEDIDAAGFSGRQTEGNINNVSACLSWLARFHALFIGEQFSDLWPVGGYWHLATRPDELANMPDSALKHAAPVIDKMLNDTAYNTLIHGDAKLANFCFSDCDSEVAALDFQYAGGGPGIKDVVLLLASSLDNAQLCALADRLLQHYFAQLQQALNDYQQQIDFAALEASWRQHYPLAWADYQRFLDGWKPGHARITPYMQKQTATALSICGQ